MRGGLVAGLMALLAGGAFAREPAELPPAGYAGQQYVDSRGCLFLRAGVDGRDMWIPRVSRKGQPVCGYPPSGRRVPLAGEAGQPEVQVQPEVAAKPVPPPVVVPSGEEVMVLLGRFKAASGVERKVKALGLPVITTPEEGGVAVYAGPFMSRTAAKAALKIVKAAGFGGARIMR